MPKKKTAASLEAYDKKLDEIKKINAAKLKPYYAKKAKVDADKKKKESLLRKIEAKKTAIRGL